MIFNRMNTQFVYPFVNGPFGRYHVLATVNNAAALNTGVQTPLRDPAFVLDTHPQWNCWTIWELVFGGITSFSTAAMPPDSPISTAQGLQSKSSPMLVLFRHSANTQANRCNTS